MGTRTGILLGAAIGYVLGTRAGRERYEQIKAFAARLRRTSLVSRPLDAAGERTAEAIRSVGLGLADSVAETVKERVFGMEVQPQLIEAVTVEPVDQTPAPRQQRPQ